MKKSARGVELTCCCATEEELPDGSGESEEELLLSCSGPAVATRAA